MPGTARDAILSFHNPPENYYTAAQCATDFRAVVVRLNAFSQTRGGPGCQ